MILIVILYKENSLSGQGVQTKETTLNDLQGIFIDKISQTQLNLVAYSVEYFQPVALGTEGGLFFGISKVNPGLIGDEYFMTKGHFHSIRNRSEFYWCLEGQGILLLMDVNRQCRYEVLSQGSLHYIPGHVAHRLVNVGKETLVVGACWPSDSGHDYDSVESFSMRVFRTANDYEIKKYECLSGG